MIAYCGQTREPGLIAELEELGIGECTQRGELPPRRSRWFYDCRTFADWRAGRSFNGWRWQRDQWRIRDRGLRPDFGVVPDLIAAGLRSLELSARERPFMAPGVPAYLVVQEEMTPELVAAWLDEQPDPYHGIFVGGAAIEWKLVDPHGARARDALPPRAVRPAGSGAVGALGLPLRARSKMVAFLEALGHRVPARRSA